jgi:hypothetical protein
LTIKLAIIYKKLTYFLILIADKQTISNDGFKFPTMPAQLKPAAETLTIKAKDHIDFLSLLTFYGKLVVPRTKYTEHLIKNQNEFLIIIPLLRDTIALSHTKFIKQFDIYFSLARNLFNSSKSQIKLQSSNRNLVWSCYTKFLKSCDNSFALYVNELPGLDRLSIQDYGKLMNEKVYIVIDLCLRELFVDGECYLYLDGVNLDKHWMNELFGKEMSDDLFEAIRALNQLNPTRNEIALLAAFVITSGSGSIDFDNFNK